jgi:hypothetical protein
MSRPWWRAQTATVVALALGVSGGFAALGAGAPPAGAATSGPQHVVRFDAVKYASAGCASITVGRANLSDPDPDPTLEVASLGGDAEQVALVPTGTDAWSASVCRTSDPVQPGDGTLQVQPGDHVLAATRVAGAPSGLDVAAINGGTSLGGVQVTLNPQPLPPKLRSILNPEPLGPRRLRNARLIQPDGSVVYFSEDQVIFRESAPGDLAAFLARHPSAAVLNSITLSDAPGGPVEPITSTYHAVYVNARKYPTADLGARLEEVGANGAFEFTSQRAIELYALIVDEQNGGTQVFPNTISLRTSVPSTDEAVNSSTPVDLFNSSNANRWFNPRLSAPSRVGTPQALALLDVMKQDARPRTKVAVIDSGFAGPNDYKVPFTPPDYGAPNGDFNQIPQCSANLVGKLACGGGQASGKGALPCGGGSCPWHGAQMASVAAGRLDNGGPATDGGGTAGVGAQTAELMLYKVDWSYFLPISASVNDATASGARVINLSSGFPCAQFIDLCSSVERTLTKMMLTAVCLLGGLILGIACDLAGHLLDLFADVDGLQKAVVSAVAMGVVVVASAGNDGKDAANAKVVPCIWPGVICVGNLMTGGGDLSPSPNSNFGAALDLWAPGTSLATFETPAPKSTSTSGTSPAAAFTSGVVSIVRSVAPNLSGAQVRQLLDDAVCRTGHTVRVDGSSCTPSADARVDANGYLDVLDALHRARVAANLPSLTGCTGGWDQLVDANDDPVAPRTIPGSPFPFQLSGELGVWRGDATVKRPSFTADGQVDGQWYSMRIDPLTIPQNAPKSLNTKLELHTPDIGLGPLTLEVYSIVQPGYGNVPPQLKLVNPYSLVDTASGNGTGEWRGYLILSKSFLVHVVAVQPEMFNNNCFDFLRVTAMEGGGTPPTREAGFGLGGATVISGRNVSQIAGATNVAVVPVTLTQPLPYTAQVDWATSDATAKAGIDYLASSGTVVFPPGTTYQELLIPVETHTKPSNLAFRVDLSNPNGPPIYDGVALVGILEVTAKGLTPLVEVAASSTFEGDIASPRGVAIVQLDRPAVLVTTVTYSITSTDATVNVDYTGSGGTVTIPRGHTYGVIRFPIIGDTEPENFEEVTVTLTGTQGAAALGSRTTAEVHILDDDDF